MQRIEAIERLIKGERLVTVAKTMVLVESLQTCNITANHYWFWVKGVGPVRSNGKPTSLDDLTPEICKNLTVYNNVTLKQQIHEFLVEFAAFNPSIAHYSNTDLRIKVTNSPGTSLQLIPQVDGWIVSEITYNPMLSENRARDEKIFSMDGGQYPGFYTLEAEFVTDVMSIARIVRNKRRMDLRKKAETNPQYMDELLNV